jgi:hypothetical protein
MVNPVPVALACETVTLAVPVFVRVTATESVAPITRVPKLTLEGFAESCP